MRVAFGALAAAFAATALAAQVQATTIVRLTEEQMVSQADWVGVAEIQSSQSQWVGNRLFTRIELRVSESLKGSAGPELTLMLPGGRDLQRGIAMVIPGMPDVFPRNAKIVLFARKTQVVAGAVEPVGLMQGMKIMTAGDLTSVKTAAPLAVRGDGQPLREDAVGRLDAMRVRIRELVARGAQGGNR